jgi:excisionase family DNA binding protein
VDLDDLRTSCAAVVTGAQAASVFEVDVRTVARAIESGGIPAVRLGRRVLIPRLPPLAVLSATPARERPMTIDAMAGPIGNRCRRSRGPRR